MATNNQDSEYYYGDGNDDGLSNDFDQSPWQSQPQGPQVVVSPQLQAMANLAAYQSLAPMYDDTPDWGEGSSRQAELAGTYGGSNPAFPAYPDGASLNSAHWEAEEPSPDLDGLDDLANQMEQQHLGDNFAMGTGDPWAGQEHYEEEAPDYWDQAAFTQYTGAPSYVAGTDPATEAWQDPNFQQDVRNGLDRMEGGLAFRLGGVPGGDVVVSENSPLAGNTPEGSPRPSLGDAPTGVFMAGGTNRTLFQRLASGDWEVAGADTRMRVGNALAYTAEGLSRIVRQPMGVAAGATVGVLVDMYNTATRLGQNFANRPFDVRAAAADVAELTAQGLHIATQFTIASSADWEQRADGSRTLTFDGERIRRAGVLGVAEGAAYAVSGYFSQAQERHERHERDRARGDVESRRSVSERHDDREDRRERRDDRGERRERRDDRGEHRERRDDRRDDRGEHRMQRERRDDREHRVHRERRERTHTSTSSVAGMSSPYAENVTDDRGESSSMSSGSHHSRQRKNRAKAPAGH